MRPRAELRVRAAPPSAAPLPVSSLWLSRSLAWPVGQAEAELPPGTELPETGTAVTLTGAADGDQLQPLFAGRVLQARPGAWGCRLLLEEFTGPLTRLHQARTVESGNAAQLAGDLCQAAGLEQFMPEPPGATLPFLALLPGPSAMDYLRKLAFLSGQLLWPDARGTLHMGMPPTAPAGMLKRDGPLVDWQMTGAEEDDGPTISGDGAMGSGGPGAAHWLLQDPASMTSGDGPLRHTPALKAMADVTRAATMAGSRHKEAGRIRRVTLAGIPPADLGEVITLSGFPTGDGPARIAGVELLCSVTTGFLTTLDLQGLGV